MNNFETKSDIKFFALSTKLKNDLIVFLRLEADFFHPMLSHKIFARNS